MLPLQFTPKEWAVFGCSFGTHQTNKIPMDGNVSDIAGERQWLEQFILCSYIMLIRVF